MCFSATASFVAAGVTGSRNSGAARRAQHPSEWPLAAVPLIFAAQQGVEGLLCVAAPSRARWTDDDIPDLSVSTIRGGTGGHSRHLPACSSRAKQDTPNGNDGLPRHRSCGGRALSRRLDLQPSAYRQHYRSPCRLCGGENEVSYLMGIGLFGRHRWRDRAIVASGDDRAFRHRHRRRFCELYALLGSFVSGLVFLRRDREHRHPGPVRMGTPAATAQPNRRIRIMR